MNNQTKTNFNNNIINLSNAYHKLYKFNDEQFFDEYISVYGKNKLNKILGIYGFPYYNILPNSSGAVVNQITKNMVAKATNKRVKYAKIYSKYLVKSYGENNEFDFLTERDKQIVFDCLVLKDNVNIKKNYSIAELKQAVCDAKMLLIGVREVEIKNNNFFNKNLIEVDREYISSCGNLFLKRNILPSIRYINNAEILKNTKKFDYIMPKLKAERVKVKKEILKKLLAFELEHEQLELSDNLEKMQNKLVKLASSYQTSATELGSQLSQNQKLLQLLDKNFANQSDEFEL
ncbi:MAG: hypothetical protein ACI4TZ_04345 [Christensenellales bacterium]